MKGSSRSELDGTQGENDGRVPAGARFESDGLEALIAKANCDRGVRAGRTLRGGAAPARAEEDDACHTRLVESVTPPRLEGTYRVGPGRSLGFAEYGNPHGAPVVWFHGTPGGRHQVTPRARACADAMGIRLVVVERPGIGESTRHIYPNIAAAADDVLALADRLGVHRFATAGLSGGGPYALACAARAPERVTAVAVLSSVAPAQGAEAVEGGLMALATKLRGLLELGHRPIGDLLHLGLRAAKPFTSQLFEAYVAISPDGDKRVFRQPGMKRMFTEDLNTAVRRQAHAPVLDVLLFTRPWGFLLRDITAPVRFWHGDADTVVPLAHAEHMAALVSDSELRVRPAESHLGGLDAMEEVFRTIRDLWPNADGQAGAGS